MDKFLENGFVSKGKKKKKRIVPPQGSQEKRGSLPLLPRGGEGRKTGSAKTGHHPLKEGR